MTMQNIPEFSDLSSTCMQEDSCGSLQHTKCNPFHLSSFKKNAISEICQVNAVYFELYEIPGKVLEKYFGECDLSNLSDTYGILYPDCTIPHIPRKHLLFYDLKVLGEHFTSKKSHSQKSCAIMAYWGEQSHFLKVGLVEYFFVHTIVSPRDSSSLVEASTQIEHIFAKVKWYQDHFRPLHYHYPIHLVCTLFEPENKYSFIPVSRVLCRCALSPKVSLTFDYGQDDAIVTSPYFLTHANLL